jgi:hypothetical protein
MNEMIVKRLLRQVFHFLIFFGLSYSASAQKTGNTDMPYHFGGAVTVTNNGISFIPNFTLGKPAIIFDLTAGRRLTFEPQFRFSLEGKPWSILFWWRYRLIDGDKFKLGLGAHPALSFKVQTYTVDSIPKQVMTVVRYVAGELTPTYYITKGISTGVYLFYSHGLDKESIKNSEMVALRINFNKINLSKQIFLRFNPQIYYLKQDTYDGFYFSESLSLLKVNFPLSISSIINTPIRSDIPANYGFIWNISIIYTFNKEYSKQ